MLQETRVHFDPSADGSFRIQLTEEAGAGQDVACDFKPFLTDEDYEDLRWYLEDYMNPSGGGAVVHANSIER